MAADASRHKNNLRLFFACDTLKFETISWLYIPTKGMVFLAAKGPETAALFIILCNIVLVDSVSLTN